MSPVVGILVALLAAQTEGSIVAALPGTTRSAGLGGAGVALAPPAFSAHFLHFVTPRMVQIRQMNVPQSSQG